jgi:hypothetical protein
VIEGAAVIAGVRAAVAAQRNVRATGGRRQGSRVDEEDPLFIG